MAGMTAPPGPLSTGAAVSKGLLCPDCRGALSEDAVGGRCAECGRSFRRVDRALELLPRTVPRPSLEDIRAWDDTASGRTEHDHPWLALLTKEAQVRHLGRLLDGLDLGGATVLEIGGGLCWGSLVVKQRHPSAMVVATDVSASALRLAATVGDMAGAPPDLLYAADVHRLPFADAWCDLVVGSEVLHHLDDPVAGLREIRRVLRPGGRYVGIGEGFASKGMLHLLHLAGMSRSLGGHEAGRYQMKEAIYPLREWRAMFERAGFPNPTLRPTTDPTLQYHSARRLRYYALIDLLPRTLVRHALGCSLEITAVAPGL